jgi:hypothetical protein
MTTTRQALEALCKAVREHENAHVLFGLRAVRLEAETALASAPEQDAHLLEAAEILRMPRISVYQREQFAHRASVWRERDQARTPATGKDPARAEFERLAADTPEPDVSVLAGDLTAEHFASVTSEQDSVPAEPPGEVVSHEAARKAVEWYAAEPGDKQLLRYIDQQEQAERQVAAYQEAAHQQDELRMFLHERIAELEAEVDQLRDDALVVAADLQTVMQNFRLVRYHRVKEALERILGTPPSQPTEPAKEPKYDGPGLCNAPTPDCGNRPCMKPAGHDDAHANWDVNFPAEPAPASPDWVSRKELIEALRSSGGSLQLLATRLEGRK